MWATRIWTLSMLVFVWACDDADPAVSQGALGETCYANATCNTGLLCADALCIEADAGPVDPDADITADTGVSPDGAPLQDAAPVEDALPPDAAPTGCPEVPCAGQQTCAADGTCVEASPCAADVDCFDGRRCLDAQCTGPCQEDSDCPGTRLCVEGLCPEPMICVAADDCDSGRVCQDGDCLAACEGAPDCPGNQFCELPAGLCRESGACDADADCEGTRVCAAGACVDGCTEDADCEGTRTCDPVTRQCPEPAQCFVPEDCDADRACATGLCTDTCVDARPCPGAQRCDQALGLCMEPEVCQQDDDCQAPRICNAGQCYAPCVVDAECPGAQTCDADTGHCVGAAGCEADQDCPGLEICGLNGLCFMPDCAENDDCDGACVEQICAAAAPMACAVNGDCPGAQICAQGACVLSGACAMDAECPAGTPRCDAVANRCVRCSVQNDCGPNARCELGVCRHSGACEADEDCPGSRLCQGGQCTPDACEGDAFDRDPAGPQLLRRTYLNLMLCDGSEDHYSVHLPAGEGVRVALRHAPAAGDLALAIYDLRAPQAGTSSDLRHGVEQVGFLPANEDRMLEVVVHGHPGASVPYQLTVEALPPGACVPDGSEGLRSNDDRALATPLGASTYEVALCPGDQDWFALDLPAGSHVALHLDKQGPRAQLSVIDPIGQPLAQTDIAGESGDLGADITQSGRHLLHFSAEGAATAITGRLRVEIWPTTEAQACEAPTALLADVPLTPAPHLPVSRFSTACAPLITPEMLFSFTLDEPAAVTLQATGGHAIALRRTCDDQATERACAEGPAPALRDVQLEAGTWFAVLEIDGISHPTVTLRVSAVCVLDADCGDGVCDGGLCHPLCQEDLQCPGAQRCLPNGHCQEPEECGADEDCVGQRTCRFDGQCFLPECETNSDCDGACVDETCQPEVPAACDADGDCPGAQICTPLRACALDGPCAQNAECPAGTPICEPAQMRCVVCTADAHCQAGERCDGGRCQATIVCDDADDCPGDRICVAAMCQPSGDCAGDRFDGPGPPTALAERTYGGLLLCDGAFDRYTLQVPPGEIRAVVLRHDPALGDLSLTINQLPPLVDQLSRSDGALGVETAQIEGGLLGQAVEIAIQGRAGFDTPYTLTVVRPDANACAPDALEGATGNNDAEHATPLSAGTQRITLCPGDEDWFALDLAAGTQLSARAQPNTPAAIAMSLAQLDAPLLAEAQADAGAWALSAPIEATGRHLLRVHAPNEAEAQALDLVISAEAAPNAAALACAAPTPIVAGQPLQFAPTLNVLRFELSCGFGAAGLSGDHLATFTLAAPATVSLTPSPGTTVALRSVCADADHLCAFSGDPALTNINLPAGTWYAIVQTMEPLPPTLLLTVH